MRRIGFVEFLRDNWFNFVIMGLLWVGFGCSVLFALSSTVLVVALAIKAVLWLF